MVICLERGADLHGPADATATRCLFASVKSRLVLPFWYWLTWVVQDKGPLNRCVCLSMHTKAWHIRACSFCCFWNPSVEDEGNGWFLWLMLWFKFLSVLGHWLGNRPVLSIISANLKHHLTLNTPTLGQSVMHALVLSLPICRPNLTCLTSHFRRCDWDSSKFKVDHMTGGSVADWLAC